MVLISAHLPKTVHANLNYLPQKITIHLEEKHKVKKKRYLHLATWNSKPFWGSLSLWL